MSVTIQIPESETGEFIPLIINIDYRKRLSLSATKVSASASYIRAMAPKRGVSLNLSRISPLRVYARAWIPVRHAAATNIVETNGFIVENIVGLYFATGASNYMP